MQRNSSKRKINYFDSYEIRRFFDILKKEQNTRDLLFFLFVFRYGLRVGEAISIRLDDLKPDSIHPIEININRLKDGISRHYPINPEDSKVLKRWLKQRATFPNAAGNRYLFITRKSALSHMTRILAQKLHEKYSGFAGLPRDKQTNIHAWRHSTAIDLLMRGKDIYYIKAHLGHKSLQSSLVYLDIAPPQWSELSQNAILDGFRL